MISIPKKDKKFSQTNLSDTTGNIWYTKNINFDETGYLKLSSRAVSIASKEDYSNMGYPMSIGRYDTTGKAYIVTSNNTDNAFDIDILNGTLVVSGNSTTGGNRPTGSINNRGTWWQNRWYVTTNTGMNYNSSGTWTVALTSTFTTGYPHPLEVFRSRTTLCVGDKNVLRQYDTSHSAGTSLTLPTDYNINCLAYCGEKMGIGTKIDSSISGQNQEAIFATWDGLQTSANSIYPVGSDMIISVKAYKSSWVILTRNGKLLYFNGGGFDTLATLPFFFKKYIIPIDSMFGDVMTVEGDLIYINCPADISYFGVKQERFLQNFNGGILCYDPKVGLYHRYSPSFSKVSAISVSSVNTTSDILTSISGTIPDTGNPILYTANTSSVIGGLTVGTVYYVIKHTSTTFSLATTKQNASDGVKIDLTSNTTGTFWGLALTDYGTSQTIYSLGLATFGGQGFNFNHLIFGTYGYNPSAVAKENICVTVPQFSNRGYFVTPRIESSQVDDHAQLLYLKYKPLKTQDSIIIKHKSNDVIGLPVSTFQLGISCTWTSSTTLTTTADLSEAYTYLQTSGNEAECEIIWGAGAGQMPQISSIGYSGGTYTITLAEEVEGVSSSNQCGIIIDNWKKFQTITSSDSNGWIQIPIARTSKWHKFKIELRGVETTVEELQVISKTNTPSN